MEKFVLVLFAALVPTSGAVEVVYAQVGKSVVLKPPQNNLSHKYVTWSFNKKDGLQLAWANPFGGSGVTDDVSWKTKLTVSVDSLEVKNVQQENFGSYFCEIISKGETIFHSIKLIKLDVSANPPDPLLVGESLSLSCAVECCKDTEIHWLNPRGERVKNSQGKVAVRVTSQDDGKWTCVVAEAKRVEITVKVVGLSPAPPLPQYTSTSSPITVPCSIRPHITMTQFKARGLQEVHWQFFPKTSRGLDPGAPQKLFSLSLDDPLRWKADRHRELSPLRDPKTGDLTLTRKLGRADDRGDYVCTMTFQSGLTLNRTVHVEVLQIASSPGTHLSAGQPLNLTCSVGHQLPSDLQLRWTPSKQSAQNPLISHQSPARFTIPSVSADDGGSWECALSKGETRLTTAVITLTIAPKLSVWMLVLACSAAVILILFILVVALILHRRRHRKMRHLRHQLCRCKTPKPKGFYRT